jgi:PHD/YefM family antitoxin component YafN of YafNO toxin-antitoxin module
MQNNQLNRLLKLINRTGDRLVVLDKDTESAVVLMEIDEYEKLLDGGPRLENMSESDILDKINREVAVWREKNLANSVSMESEDDLAAPTTENTKNEPDSEDLADEGAAENELEIAEVSQKEAEKPTEEPITINPIVGPEEELKDVPDDGEEEKFYLEPV